MKTMKMAVVAAALATVMMAGSAFADDFTPVAVPEVPDLGGQTSNEWLLAQEDKIPLAGIQSNALESRADVEKGLGGLDLEKEKPVICWLGASAGTTFFTTMQDSAQKACDEYGYEMMLYDANFDLTTQQNQLETALSLDIDWLVCNAVDIHATSDFYTKFAEKGVPVIVVGPTAAKDDYNIVTTILSGSWASGYEDGMYVAEKVWGQYPDGLKWGTMIDKLGDADSESRPCGFIAGYLYKYAELAGTPYESKWDAAVIAYNFWTEARDNGSATMDGIMDLVGYVTVNNIATSAAAPAAADLLTAHPDMDLVFVETDSHGLAMVTEMQQRGLTPGQDMLVAYGADGTAEICKAIKDGEVMCIGNNCPYFTGEGTVNLIHDIYEGFDAQDLPANSYTPTYAVTAENVDDVWSEDEPYAAMAEGWKIQTTAEFNEANK